MAENPIFAINARVAEMRAHGADIVMLTAGEPQTATAGGIIEAAQAAIADEHTHHYGPAAGDLALRRAVARSLPGEAGTWNDQDVLITSGAKHALYLAVRALTDPGDEVLVVEPGWPGHAAAVQAASAVPVPVRSGDDLQITADILRASATPRTRAVILASPANPTGVVIPPDQLRTISQWATAADVWIISDDVYSAFDYTDTYTHVVDASPDVRERVVIIDSVSKEHAMTGWRVGWLAGPPAVVKHAREHLAATITNVPLAMQAAATAALNDTDTPARARALYRKRRDRLAAALNAIPGVQCPVPDGGMFVFPSVRAILDHHGWPGAAIIADRLLDDGVAVVPGEAFQAPDRLRICYAVEDTTLEAAILRLRSALTKLFPEGEGM